MTLTSKHADRRLLLAVALLLKLGLASAAEFNSGLQSVLTFIEVRIEMRGHAGNVLRQQVEGVSRSEISPGRMVVMQEMARPERFATLEHKASSSDSRTTVARNSRAFPESILDDLIAPPDQRAYRVFKKVVAASTGLSSDSPANYLVITNLDVALPSLGQVEAALHRVTAAVRGSDGNLGIEILQQVDRPNQFALITAWIGEAPFHNFTATAGAREFRRTIAPILDSPYDERLFRRVE